MTNETEQVKRLKQIQRRKRIGVLAEVLVELYQTASSAKDLDRARDLRFLMEDLITEEKNKGCETMVANLTTEEEQ